MDIIELDATGFTNAAKPGESTFECAIWSNLFTGLPGSGTNFFTKGSVNRAQFNIPEIIEKITQLNMTVDENARNELLREIQILNHDLVGNVPLFWREMSFAINENLGGIEYNVSPCYRFKDVYKIEK